MFEITRRGIWRHSLWHLVSFPLTAIGLAAVLSGYFKYDPDWYMPNAQASLAAISSNGDVFIVSPVYSRIQKFDARGKFIRGWPLASGRDIHLALEQDQLHVYAPRKHTQERFDLNGTLLSSEGYQQSGDPPVLTGLAPGIHPVETAMDGTHISFWAQHAKPIVIPHLWWHYPALNTAIAWVILVLGFLLNPSSVISIGRGD